MKKALLLIPLLLLTACKDEKEKEKPLPSPEVDDITLVKNLHPSKGSNYTNADVLDNRDICAEATWAAETVDGIKVVVYKCKFKEGERYKLADPNLLPDMEKKIKARFTDLAAGAKKWKKLTPDDRVALLTSTGDGVDAKTLLIQYANSDDGKPVYQALLEANGYTFENGYDGYDVITKLTREADEKSVVAIQKIFKQAIEHYQPNLLSPDVLKLDEKVTYIAKEQLAELSTKHPTSRQEIVTWVWDKLEKHYVFYRAARIDHFEHKNDEPILYSNGMNRIIESVRFGATDVDEYLDQK